MENSELQIFKNEEFGQIRTVIIEGVECYEKDGTAYLKLEAVARGLGFTDKSKGSEYIRWNTVRKYLKDIGFSQEVAKEDFIPENVFYRLAMKARNEVAEKFQAKVADEIIPSIRKHGGYIAGQENMSNEELLARAILLSQSLIKEKDSKILALETEKKENAPKVEDWNTLMDTGGTFSVLDLAHCINIGRTTLFCMLRDMGICFKNEREENIPYEKPVHKDKFTTCIVNKNGRPCIQMRIYPKGIPYILKKLREHEYIDKDTEKETNKYFKDLEVKFHSHEQIA